MNEREWVKSLIMKIETKLQKTDKSIYVVAGHRLSYTNEVLTYGKDNKPVKTKTVGYETDILIIERLDENSWQPRVVIETKLKGVTTHDAITYSKKAQTHKNVHPFLRYGILIGNRGNYSLPGRLFRHGQHFDFMLSWKNFKADKAEMKHLITILNSEIKASRKLDDILFNSRLRGREKYTVLHRPLILDK